MYVGVVPPREGLAWCTAKAMNCDRRRYSARGWQYRNRNRISIKHDHVWGRAGFACKAGMGLVLMWERLDCGCQFAAGRSFGGASPLRHAASSGTHGRGRWRRCCTLLLNSSRCHSAASRYAPWP